MALQPRRLLILPFPGGAPAGEKRVSSATLSDTA